MSCVSKQDVKTNKSIGFFLVNVPKCKEDILLLGDLHWCKCNAQLTFVLADKATV